MGAGTLGTPSTIFGLPSALKLGSDGIDAGISSDSVSSDSIAAESNVLVIGRTCRFRMRGDKRLDSSFFKTDLCPK
jgi:hypothetical protein